MKRIVLCADDYGQSATISKGIIDLLTKNRLSATSCMVNTYYWKTHAKWLFPFKEGADIGLHFNLTEGKPLSKEYLDVYGKSFMPLITLLRKAFMGQLNMHIIEVEMHAQLDQFMRETGFLPRFIDGHQHIHQFPVIRDAFMKVYQDRLLGQNVYVRVVNESINPLYVFRDLKKIMINMTGAKQLKHTLDTLNIPYNQSFAGIYWFNNANHYHRLFPRFLSNIADGGLIMCHPGLPSINNDDFIAKARFREYQYLESDLFLADCQHEKIVIQKAHF